MKNLLLLRHAKSSWANPGLSDFQRPLNNRGKKSAVVMAAYLSEALPLPDVIYCSTSQRTRETLAYLLEAYAHPIDIKLSRDLYLSSPSTMLDMVRYSRDDADTVMVIAHNPGTEELASMLAGQGNEDDLNEMAFKYPTAACAHISFNVKGWSDIQRMGGHLQAFVKPRNLLPKE